VIIKESYRSFLLDVADHFEKVFVVLVRAKICGTAYTSYGSMGVLITRNVQGNHEFYANESMQQSMEAVQKICAERPEKLILMHKRSLLVDGFRIIGTTLWYERE
jgi:hypothetical protein